MRIILLLTTLLLLGCQSERNHNKNHNQVTVQANKPFKKEHHLFLNYYFGMTIEEYETATQENFINRKVFLSGEKEACRLDRYSHEHTQADIEKIGRHSTIYYEFSIGKEEFEAVLRPSFKYDRLVRMELQTLQCFNFGNHNQGFYRRKVDDTKKALLVSYTKELGKYQVSETKFTEHDLSVIQNAGVSISNFDTNKYIFTQNAKVVTIEQRCCDFKPVVQFTYTPFTDIQKAPNSPQKLERELALFNTFGEI